MTQRSLLWPSSGIQELVWLGVGSAWGSLVSRQGVQGCAPAVRGGDAFPGVGAVSRGLPSEYWLPGDILGVWSVPVWDRFL